jgi:hypothetical protein
VCVAHIGNFRLAGQKAQMLPHLASYLFSLAPHFVVETATSSIAFAYQQKRSTRSEPCRTLF